jgi:3-oxoacyl-[acyl-carrier-protein] synthase II
LLGAAGAIEAIVCVKSIEEGVIPPTINTKNIDPEIPASLNIVLGKKLKKDVKIALSNTFGFGGHNASAVFRKIS